MKKTQEDIPTKFWKEYEELYSLERGKKIKPIVDMMDKLYAIKDKKMRRQMLETGLQGYFDDLIEYASYRNDSQKKKVLRKKK